MITTEWANTPFASAKFDMGVGSFTINPERLQRVLMVMHSDGSYQAILQAWGTQGGATDTFEVRP